MDVVVIVQLAITAWLALKGWPLLLSTVLVAIQYFGKLSEEAASKVNFWGNIIFFGAITVLIALGKIDLVSTLDTTLGRFAQVLVYLLVLLGVPNGIAEVQKISKRFHAVSFIRSHFIAKIGRVA